MIDRQFLIAIVKRLVFCFRNQKIKFFIYMTLLLFHCDTENFKID